MSSKLKFKALPISAGDTYALREQVLRPGHLDDCKFEGDDAKATYHSGVFDTSGELVAIASMYRESRAIDAAGAAPERIEHEEGTAWRLRGMAVREDVRGLGAGRIALEPCIEHAREYGGKLVWCNARTPAVGFYKTQGWHTLGEEFDIETVGPHFVMELVL